VRRGSFAPSLRRSSLGSMNARAGSTGFYRDFFTGPGGK
jgi:hypothetical protein